MPVARSGADVPADFVGFPITAGPGFPPNRSDLLVVITVSKFDRVVPFKLLQSQQQQPSKPPLSRAYVGFLLSSLLSAMSKVINVVLVASSSNSSILDEGADRRSPVSVSYRADSASGRPYSPPQYLLAGRYVCVDSNAST